MTNELLKRRQLFAKNMQENSIAILFSAPEAVRSNDTHYPYRQNSDFWYLTHFTEPESVFIIIKEADNYKTILFNREKDLLLETWTGIRLGQTEAIKAIYVDEAYEIDELESRLPSLLSGKNALYHAHLQYDYADKILNAALEKAAIGRQGIYQLPPNTIDYRPFLHQMRLIKSPYEISQIKKACQISADAHIRAMKACKPNKYEYQLEAEITHEFMNNGAKCASYNTIVGGGVNACILHYENNDELLKDGDLVLIDAGCEYQHYAGDITRTFPINGKFTPAQKIIYNIVLSAQKLALSLLIPGATVFDVNQKVISFFVSSLVDIGVLKGDVDTLINDKAHQAFYMHGLGHWLGIDVHDVGTYQENNQHKKLCEGMILTVEPGLYINLDANVPSEYKGIGIRIEDDILITKTGNENLTAKVPKEINDIESLMAQSEI